MHKVMHFVAAVAAVFALSSWSNVKNQDCCRKQQQCCTQQERGIHGEWNIETAMGQSVKADGEERPFIGFDQNDNIVYGLATSNRFSGQLQVKEKKGKLKLDNVGVTRMMSADPEQEQLVIDAINQAASYRWGKMGRLVIMDKKGKTVMVLSRKAPLHRAHRGGKQQCGPRGQRGAQQCGKKQACNKQQGCEKQCDCKQQGCCKK